MFYGNKELTMVDIAKLQQTPLLIVNAVILNDHQVLLVKDTTEFFGGSWRIPGDVVRYNESPEQSVRRAVKDETGLDLESLSLIGVFDLKGKDPRGHMISLCYVATTSIFQDANEKDVLWVDVGNLSDKDIVWFQKDMIANGETQRFGGSF